jgi:hypothetical protein
MVVVKMDGEPILGKQFNNFPHAFHWLANNGTCHKAKNRVVVELVGAEEPPKQEAPVVPITHTPIEPVIAHTDEAPVPEQAAVAALPELSAPEEPTTAGKGKRHK